MRSKLRRHSAVSVDVQRILADDTPFAVKEAYRTLYTNVIYLPIEDKCKKLVITSAFPGEGKTSVSINLAYSIAMNSPESKVLIVDADMRSPRVTELINMHEKLHGLSEYLAGIDKEPNFVSTIHPNLSLLAAGAKNINSPGLISSSRMEELIKIFDETFDYVIFDTPPVNVVSDAMLLSDKVNGYIIATRADYSDINSLSDAIDNLRSADGIMHGVVLCSYNAKTGGGYGKYGKYGKYDSDYGAYGDDAKSR